MVLVKIMKPSKGHEESNMTCENLIQLVKKLYGKNYYIVDSDTMEVIRDINTITDNQSITIMPVVAGGAD